MQGKIPFWKTLIGVCSGTMIFIDILKRQPLWLALLHLMVLLCLGAFILTAVRYPVEARVFSDCGTVLDERFGAICADSVRGLVPGKTLAPDSCSFELLDGFRFDYFPNQAAYPQADSDPARHAYMGIQWDPKMVIVWQKVQEDMYLVLPVIVPEGWKLDFSRKSNPFIEKSLQDVRQRTQLLQVAARELSFNLMVKDSSPVNRLVFSELINAYYKVYAVSNGILLNFILPGISIALIILLFSFSTFIFASPPIRAALSFGRILTLTIYTAFPGVVIGVLWEIAGIQAFGLGYTQIMIYSLLVYSFAVQFRIQRTFIAPPPKDRYRDPGDDL